MMNDSARDINDSSLNRAALPRRNSRFFTRKRLGLRVGLIIIFVFYFAALFADFIAPYDYRTQARREPLAPPVSIHLRDAQGVWHLRPFIYRRQLVDALSRRYREDTSQKFYVEFLPRTDEYKLLGIFTLQHRLFGVENDLKNSLNNPRITVLGTDALGRDRFSRLIYAARFSLIVGPTGTLLACVLGVIVGCIAGYAGRLTDAVLMRLCDAVISLPTLVLILAARAALPLELPPMKAALLLIAIFAILGWAEMALVTRNLVLALREREFVLAAESLGLTRRRVLFRHILPNAMRPLIVQATLMLPVFLLAETALSYFGAGLQEPEPSWGNMLAAASDATLLRSQPFVLLAPAMAITLFVLAVRLVGDGLKPRAK